MSDGKKYRNLVQQLDRTKLYEISEACDFFRQVKSNFNETIDVAICLSKALKQSEQSIKGSVIYPYGLGKKVKIAAIVRGDLAEEARKAGADIVGEEELCKKIENGFLDFDKLITTPDLMLMVGKLGKILGPKGLMPNAKLGTVTLDISKAIQEIKSGRVEFKIDKGNIIHAPIGLLSFSEDQLKENICQLMSIIIKLRPLSLKGDYIRKVFLSSTMSPSIKLNVSQFIK